MFRLFALILFLFANCLEGETKAVFYMTDAPDSLASFRLHAEQIGIVVPTVYKVDEHGLVWGEPNPSMMEIAAGHKVPVMPIIVNRALTRRTCMRCLPMRRRGSE